MKALTLLKRDISSVQRERIISKFGVRFIIKNNQVFLLRRYGPVTYQILIENDPEFFLEMSKAWEKWEHSSLEIPLFPKKEDWEIIRKETQCIVLSFTAKCNSNCKICYAKDAFNYTEMSLKKIKKILSLFKNKTILLIGGEPTVRNDFFKIVKLVKESGNIPAVYTNGLKLANESYVKRMKKEGIVRAHFSFDSFRPEFYRKIRGDANQLYLKLRALKNLEKYNIEVFLSSVIVPGMNEDEAEKLLEFSIRNNHFIKGLYLWGATPFFGKFDVEMKKILTPSDLIKLLERNNDPINKEYFIEFKKLRVNLYRIFKKMGKFFPFGDYWGPTLFRVKDGKIEQFISLDELKKINKMIENKRVFSLTKFLLDKRFYGFPLFKFLRGPLRARYLGKNILTINVGNILMPHNFLPIKQDSAYIIEINGITAFIANPG